MLDVQELTVRYGALTIVNDVRFHVGEGQWLMVVGPNGAGKSTLINAISQGVPYTGRVLLDGRDVRRYRPNALARRMGVLSQNNAVGYAFTVEEVIRLGRYAYAPTPFSRQSGEDARRVSEAAERTGLLEILGQSVLTLSGGELQRTFIAQLLAQNPSLLLLDEPTNHLDLVYQKAVFSLLKDWLTGSGRAIVSVVHDLSLARQYGTHALLLDHGSVLACGAAHDVLTPGNLAAAYETDVYAWMRQLLAQWTEQGGESWVFKS